MIRPELHETLAALIEALEPGLDGGRVVEAALETPMEVTVSGSGRGMVFRAGPARSRFVSGVMAPVHRITLTAAHEAEDGT